MALDRQKVTLPRDFAAPLQPADSVLSTGSTDGGRRLGHRQQPPRRIRRVQTWLLPISQRENGLYQWWLNASLRGSRASEPRHYTVPLYVDKANFSLPAGLLASRRSLLVTDKAGHVVWRTTGPVTDSKKAALTSLPASTGSDRYRYLSPSLSSAAPIMFTARCAESAAPSCQPTIWLVWSPARKIRPCGWIHTS